MADWTKVDVALGTAWEAWEAAEDQDPDAGMGIVLTYQGSLAAVTAAGFAPGTNDEEVGEATGIVLFSQLAALTAVTAVVFMAAGRALQTDLVVAVRDVRARASSAGTVDGKQDADGLWFATPKSGKIEAPAGHTGANVIIATIDTGIDYTHPFFLRPGKPFESRILAIWDQGLQALTDADRPHPDLLVSEMSYGRLYTNQQINDALESETPLEHRDCDGHGTHVAGIAAGSPFAHAGAGDPIAGMAPEARIIAVKLIDVRFRRYAGTSVDVDWELAFRDAVMFCLRTAKAAGLPIVVNCSIGAPDRPGDSRDSGSRWVDRLLDPTRKGDASHFPKGAIVIKSAGNDGEAMPRDKAHIIVSASGQVEVPLQVYDVRRGAQRRRDYCETKLFAPDLSVFIWYQAKAAGTVGFSMSLPGQSAFGEEASFDTPVTQAFDYAPDGDPAFRPAPFRRRDRFQARLIHTNDPVVRLPGGKSIHRRSATLELSPKTAGDIGVYPAGIFRLRIRAPQGTKLYLFAPHQGWGSGRNVGFQIPEAPPLDAAIELTAMSSIIDGFGHHAITVAAYDDANGDALSPAFHRRAEFSSLGPLRDFTDPAANIPPLAAKPTLSAPGVDITSAASIDGEETLLQPLVSAWHAGNRFVGYEGTSMSVPMVSGAAALLLGKNPTLNAVQLRDALCQSARPGPGQSKTPPVHDSFLGSGMLDAFAAYQTVPPK